MKGSDPLWYKDAVIYELHIKAFYDSNGDGIGDINGLISRLDYLADLGVTALWLLPFYPSPLKDDGYDISDYYSVHPDYGTIKDFKRLLKEAHARGLRIITELVLNHTSDQNPWFQRARKAKPYTPERDFYVWSSTPEKYADARIIFKDFESSNWTWDPEAGAYYWHRFYSHQPDLNYDNPKVRKEMTKVIDFWMEMGVDGMRLDAVPYLFEKEGTSCENLPEGHQFLREIRSHVDSKFPDRMFLAEANQWPEDAIKYFGNGDECHVAFNFPVMPRLFMAIHMEDRFPVMDVLEPNLKIPPSCQWAYFLRNHDELTLEMVTDRERDYMNRVYAADPRSKINLGIRRRLAPLMNNHRGRIEFMNALLMCLPGTPVLYYGDEIGMGDNYYLGDRSGVRTPMQWSPDRNAGFSRANPQKLYLPVIIDPEYHYEAVNVETQSKNLSSLLWWHKRMISMRNRYRAFGRGDIQFLFPSNSKVLSFIRSYEDQYILAVFNLSRFAQVAELDLASFAPRVPVEIFGGTRFPQVGASAYVVSLPPYGFYLFRLAKEEKHEAAAQDTGEIAIEIDTKRENFSSRFVKRISASGVLESYIKGCRWFAGKGMVMQEAVVIDHTDCSRKEDGCAMILFIKVSYTQGEPQTYILPVTFAPLEEGITLRQTRPEAIICQARVDGRDGFLYDAMYSESFQRSLRETVLRKKKIRSRLGALQGAARRGLRYLADPGNPSWSQKVLSEEQSNTSVVFSEESILKLFRKVQPGPEPESEIVKALSEQGSFPNIASYQGEIRYQAGEEEPSVISMMQGFIKNQGSAWKFFLDNAGKFFETILSRKETADKVVFPEAIIRDEEAMKGFSYVPGPSGAFFVEMTRLLADRTAGMHLALGSLKDGPLSPEPFSMLYQRSLFQQVKGDIRRVMDLVQASRSLSERLSLQTGLAPGAVSEKLTDRAKKVLDGKLDCMKTRVHGDYHLGQVLFTGKDFYIIDFEGEPSRPIGERRLRQSVLKDITGMVRSFHYAAAMALAYHPAIDEKTRPLLYEWVLSWYRYTASVFLSRYVEKMKDSRLLPSDRKDFETLFRVLLIEKCVYEIGYEMGHRPEWVEIPMLGLRHILEDK